MPKVMRTNRSSKILNGPFDGEREKKKEKRERESGGEDVLYRDFRPKR